jgi:Dolichyl-phosphate-mannose-protein mannosyltransferase
MAMMRSTDASSLITPRCARLCGWILGGVTATKILALLVLVFLGKVHPFTGDNALDHYIPAAQRIAAEGRFNGPDSRGESKVAPAYSVVLALFMLTFGRQYATAVVCFQMLADLVTAIFMWRLGALFVRPEVGILAGLAWLLFPPEIVISTWITAETLFTTLLIAGVGTLLGSIAMRRPAILVFSGLVFGVATLARGTTLLLPVMLAAVPARRRLLVGAAIFLTIFGAVVGSWAIRNQVVLNERILVSVGFGGAFLQGSDERLFTIDGKHASYPEVYARAAHAGIIKPETDHEAAIDHWLFEVGMHNYRSRLKEQPLSFIAFSVKKFFLLWYATESGGWKGELLLALCSLPIVVPGLWRLAAWARVNSDFALVCSLITFYFIALHMVTGPLNRYMVPMYPILILPACDWWLGIWYYLRNKQPSMVPNTVAAHG